MSCYLSILLPLSPSYFHGIRKDAFFLFIYSTGKQLKIYNKRQWDWVRQYVLDRDLHTCQLSLRDAKYIPADTVHHIFPVETYPELAFEYWNLISVCRAEHNKLHERKTHKLTDKGKLLQRRRRNEYIRWCRENDMQPHFIE